MVTIDQAKQLLYLEEIREYRNAFKLEISRATEAKEAREVVTGQTCIEGARIEDKAEMIPSGGFNAW